MSAEHSSLTRVLTATQVLFFNLYYQVTTWVLRDKFHIVRSRDYLNLESPCCTRANIFCSKLVGIIKRALVRDMPNSKSPQSEKLKAMAFHQIYSPFRVLPSRCNL